MRGDHNNYFCVSLFHGEHRLETDFRELRVLAVDDVGIKVDAGRLLDALGTPAWALETSPGNQQWFWFLEEPVRDLAKARRLTRLVSNDARDVTRVVRLPFGRNTKAALGAGGFDVRVASKSPPGGLGRIDAEELLRELDASGGVLGRTGLGARSTTPGTNVVDLIGNDPVGRWLLRWGRVKGLTPSRLGVEISCPWEHEHTVRTSTGSAYFPKTGGFECHHGHCVNRTGLDLKMWVEGELDRSGLWEGGVAGEKWEKAEDGDDGSDEARPQDAAQKAIARYVYLKVDHKFFDLNTNLALVPEAFNTTEREPLRDFLRYLGADKKVRMLTPALWFPKVGRIADAQTYWPGRGRLFDEDGKVLVNRWRPGPRPRAGLAVDLAAVAPWRELVRALVVNEGPWVVEVTLDWFALMVGAPEIKPGWNLVWHSDVHGVGKDMALWPIRMAVGRDNVASPAAAVIGGAFNDFAEKRLVVITDLERNTRGAMTTHDIYEIIKPYTENTSLMITINRKHTQPYEAANLSGWVITTNARDALPLADSDRRFLVVSSTMVRRGDDYYSRLRAQLEKGWPDIAEALHQRWVNMPGDRRDVLLGRAPLTTGKTTMIRAAEDRLTAWTREQIEDGIWPDLMTSPDIQGRYEQAGRRVLSVVPTGAKWGPLLHRLGAKLLRSGTPVRMGGGKLCRVWAVRLPTTYERMSPKDLACAYELQSELFSP